MMWLTLGMMMLGLGTVGVFLPVLPTTPFYLLASLFFAKGSLKASKWLAQQKLFQRFVPTEEGPYQLLLSDKIKAMITASFFIGLSIILSNQLWIQLILIICALIMAWVLFGVIQTKQKDL